jgi:uncharacterized protein YeaO (DUF488 family)
MAIKVKRVYEEPKATDGVRILVDRLWPRGLKKENAQIDYWLKDLAPSTALRQWFNHDEKKWVAFQKRYAKELADKQALIDSIQSSAKEHTVTLLFGSKEMVCNNAVALRNFLVK